VLVAERGPLVFVFNWHPHDDYEGMKVAAPEPGMRDAATGKVTAA
jgi:1,4-alpha-glucan branching enzyme